MFWITALPSHPFSNLEQHRGIESGWSTRGPENWVLSNYRLNLLLTLAWLLNTYILSTLEEGFYGEQDAACTLREPCLGETLPYNQHIPKMLRSLWDAVDGHRKSPVTCAHFCCSQLQLVIPSALRSGPSVMSNVNQLFFQAAALHLAHEKSGCWLDEWVWWLSQVVLLDGHIASLYSKGFLTGHTLCNFCCFVVTVPRAWQAPNIALGVF